MKEIKTNIPLEQIKKDLNVEIDTNSPFVLLEKGFEPSLDLINIVFDKYNPVLIKELMNKSGYFKTQKHHLVGKKDNEMELIHLKNIVYIEGINNDTYVHTKSDEYLIKDKLYELENKLMDQLFVRVSKSYIVSINYINKIKPTFNGKLLLIMDNGIELEVSRHYISNFRAVLGM